MGKDQCPDALLQRATTAAPPRRWHRRRTPVELLIRACLLTRSGRTFMRRCLPGSPASLAGCLAGWLAHSLARSDGPYFVLGRRDGVIVSCAVYVRHSEPRGRRKSLCSVDCMFHGFFLHCTLLVVGLFVRSSWLLHFKYRRVGVAPFGGLPSQWISSPSYPSLRTFYGGSEVAY